MTPADMLILSCATAVLLWVGQRIRRRLSKR